MLSVPIRVALIYRDNSGQAPAHIVERPLGHIDGRPTAGQPHRHRATQIEVLEALEKSAAEVHWVVGGERAKVTHAVSSDNGSRPSSVVG